MQLTQEVAIQDLSSVTILLNNLSFGATLSNNVTEERTTLTPSLSVTGILLT